MSVHPGALSALDQSFLYMESPHTPMHMESIGIFEGDRLHDRSGRLRLDEIRDEVTRRLHLVPKLRRCVRLPLFGEAAPVWVDDPEFDVANHVHQAALPAPGDDEQLLAFCADLMAYPLDRSHPLWHIWLVDGLAGGRVAVVELLHHALADGLAGVELATVLLDLEPRTQPVGEATAPADAADDWLPSAPPGRLAVVGWGLEQVARVAGGIAGAGWRLLQHPSRTPHRLARGVSAVASVLADPTATAHSSLNRPVGFDRRAVVVRQPFDELRRAERRFGVTLNDLLLTAVGSGFHDLLSGRGEVMEGRHLHVLVPVGTDHAGDHALGNEVSAMVVPVPVGAAPAVERLREVAGAERRSKADGQAGATHALLAALDAWPPAALSAATRLVPHQPLVNVVVTNVPGPAAPLFMLGARMLEAIPLVPLGGNLSVGIAALSYCGQLSVGILADPHACPDVAVLASGIQRCFGELTAAGRDPVAALATR